MTIQTRTEDTRQFVRIKDDESLVRDMDSMAVINSDVSAYTARKLRKEAAARQRAQIEEQKRSIESLHSDMAEIKQMLATLLGQIHDRGTQ